MKRFEQLQCALLVAAVAAVPTPACPQDSTAPAPAKPRVEQVISVFKTHFDIGYTDMASNVVQRYRTTMVDQALKVVDQNRELPPEQQFTWTIPGWPLKKIAEDWPGQTAERKEKILQAFKDGRFVVHALPFTTHTESLEPEDLVRGLGFASRLSRDAGLPLPRDAKMTDVPCHSWILPTLLRHAGVDFLHLGCNAASSSPQVPRLFWWEGPDGSRLLTMYTAESYGTGLVAPPDWPYQTWLALIHTGDNHGPPTPDEVKKLLDQAKQKLPGVKVRIGRLSDFADAILAEVGTPTRSGQSPIVNRQSQIPPIPVVRGDMPDTWIHGPMSDPQGAKLARNVRPAITTAELLNTLLRAWGLPAPDIRRTVADAYEQSLLYGEHTWGGAQSWVTKYGSDTKWSYGDTWRAERGAGRFKRLEESWAEHTAYIENAQRLIQPVLRDELKMLARAVAYSGERIVVFNPLPWRRNDWVNADMAGNRVPSLKPAGGPLPFLLASGVEPLGYRTFVRAETNAVSTPLPVDSKQATLESPFFKVLLDPAHGAIRSFVDKRTGRDWVNGSAPHGFGQYLYERFDSNNVAAYVRSYVKISADWAINELGKPNLPPAVRVPYVAATPRHCQVSAARMSGWVAATMDSRATQQLPRITTRLVLYAQQPYVDLEVTIHNKPADPWPEAAWICLPFNIASPQFRVGRPGSIIDLAKDIVPGANHDLYAVDTGVAVFGPDGRGFGICPLDSPLVSLGEPGGWKYRTNSAPKRAAIFVNLFNNQWTTNFRFWNEGTWTSRIRIWMFDRYDPWSSLIKPSLEARFPLQAAMASGPGGWLPLSLSGLAVTTNRVRSADPLGFMMAEGGGVLVSAFGGNPEGAGTLLRFWEMTGKSGVRYVSLPASMNVKSVQPVNLRGQPEGQPIPILDGSFSADLRAFAPASFLIGDR